MIGRKLVGRELDEGRAGTEVGEAGRALEQCWKKVGEGWKRVTRRLEKGHKKA